jgi:hypothetical protein
VDVGFCEAKDNQIALSLTHLQKKSRTKMMVMMIWGWGKEERSTTSKED